MLKNYWTYNQCSGTNLSFLKNPAFGLLFFLKMLRRNWQVNELYNIHFTPVMLVKSQL